jgi:hypothetical protein
MLLTKDQILDTFNVWLTSWDHYDIDGVMNFIHDDITFENWDGTIITGKKSLRRAWIPWFINHGNFKFRNEEIFIDEREQKLLFRWCLEWPSLEVAYKGKPEVRRGVDVIHLRDGKIILKLSYSKTTIQVNSSSISLNASK